MKTLLFIFGILVAGILGYSTEPKLHSALTFLPQPKAENPPPVKPEDSASIDLASLAPNQLPEKVTLTSKVKFTQKSSGPMLSVDVGSEVALVRIEGNNAVVRPGDATYLIEVPVEHTDLIARLRSKPLPLPIFPKPDPEPAPEPAPEPTPAPEPAPTPTPPATPATDAPPAAPTNVVIIMQESVRDGQIKEFKFEQVLGWKAGENETMDKQVFQTGLVSYKAETIFGVKTIQAKALIQDGKVVRWIWPKSGMEIK
jgi:hypothetical protein